MDSRKNCCQRFVPVRGILDKGEYPNLSKIFDHKPEYFVVE